MKSMIVIFLIVMTSSLYAQTKTAMVKRLRGEVDVLTLGKTTRLKLNDWVEQGAVIKTGDKSFVQLVFIDKSTMNVSANSEMKIEEFSGKDSGVIDLVKGRIRSTVTKDYLQIQEKDKSKLFIKTQNAVMGVRGTDFLITTNGKTTSTFLFEGEIAFNRLDKRGNLSTRALEDIVDRGVRLFPKDFSVMDHSRPMPTVPARMNMQQFEKLEKNTDFKDDKSVSTPSVTKSIVPAGLTGQIVSNNNQAIKTDQASPSSADPEGYVKGNLVKPANGSFVHLETGTIIPPEPDAVLDPNTNTFISNSSLGNVADDGSFVPKDVIKITEEGVFKQEPKATPTPDSDRRPTSDENAESKDKESESELKTVAISPVLSPASLDMPIVERAPAQQPISDIPLPGSQGAPIPGAQTCGGICNVNDPTRIAAPGGMIDTTIIVKP